MRGRLGYWIAAGVVLLALLSTWFAVSGPRSAPVNAPPVSAEPHPSGAEAALDQAQIELEGLALSDYDEQGNLLWRVRSHGKLSFDRKRQLATGTDIDWELARGAGEHIRVRAPQFVIDLGHRQIRFSEGIEATSSVNDISFRCGAVLYEMDARMLTASGTVEGTFGDYAGRADRLEVHSGGNEARLQGAATVKQGPYTASAEEVLVDLKARTAQATGSPEFTGEGWDVHASKVTFDAASGRAAASGSVRARQGKQKARCDRLAVSRGGKVAELRGSVRFSGKQFEAEAEALTIDVDAGTATFPKGVKAKTKVRM